MAKRETVGPSRREENVVLVLSVVIEAIRHAKKAKDTYELDLGKDPDGIFEQANKLLAERAQLPSDHPDHIDRDLILLPPKLYSGKMRVIDDKGDVREDVEKMVREQLSVLALHRGGTLRGISIEEIGKMNATTLEELRKEVCSLKNGAVQFENHCLYYVGGARTKWSHPVLGKMFRELSAITKVDNHDRVYAFTFTGSAVTDTMRQARAKLKEVTKAAAEKKATLAKQKLEEKQAERAAKRAAKEAEKKEAAEKVEA